MERSQDDNTTQKGDMKDIKNYRPISQLSHMYKLFTWILQKRMEKVLDEKQPREETGFRKCYSTVDHLQTVNQLIKNCEFKRPLCVGFIAYEKAFDSINGAILKALRSIGINGTYINILEDIYTGATARLQIMNNQISEEIPILRGVKQGNPISPKLFTATIQKVFKTPSQKRKE